MRILHCSASSKGEELCFGGIHVLGGCRKEGVSWGDRDNWDTLTSSGGTISHNGSWRAHRGREKGQALAHKHFSTASHFLMSLWPKQVTRPGPDSRVENRLHSLLGGGAKPQGKGVSVQGRACGHF